MGWILKWALIKENTMHFRSCKCADTSSLDDAVDINARAAAQLANTDLHKVVKDPQTIRVFALLYLHKGPQLRGAERDVLVSKNDLELLPAYSVWCRPFIVILLQNL